MQVQVEKNQITATVKKISIAWLQDTPEFLTINNTSRKMTATLSALSKAGEAGLKPGEKKVAAAFIAVLRGMNIHKTKAIEIPGDMRTFTGQSNALLALFNPTKKKSGKKVDATIITETGTVSSPPAIHISPKAGACLDRIKNSMKNMSTNFLDLGEALLEAKEAEFYKEWGYTSFKKWVEGEADLGFPLADKYACVAEAVRAAGWSREDIAGIGWTKLFLLKDKIAADPDNANALLEEARAKTVREIKDGLTSGKKTVTPGEMVNMIRVSASWPEDEGGRLMSDAIRAAFAELGMEPTPKKTAEALLHIGQEWFMSKAVSGAGQVSNLADYLNYIEKRFNVSVQATEGRKASQAEVELSAPTFIAPLGVPPVPQEEEFDLNALTGQLTGGNPMPVIDPGFALGQENDEAALLDDLLK